MLYVLIVGGISAVVNINIMVFLMNVMSPPPATYRYARCYVLCCVCFRSELGFLKSYDICMCEVNKEFEF